MLAPVFGEMLPQDAEPESLLQMPCSQGVVHEAMLTDVKLKVFSGQKDRRRKAGAEKTRTSLFALRSPLLVGGKSLKGRDECLQNVAPFWAVLRCAGPRAAHNMEFDSVVMGDAGFHMLSGKYAKMPQGVQFSVDFPILRNVRCIDKGEVLCLPFLAD